MIKIETKEGLKVSWEGSRITLDNCGNLIDELNSWLNNGYKLVKIECGTYFLESDETQLMWVVYDSKDGYYSDVMTHANAFCIRQYYGACLNIDDDDEIVLEEFAVSMTDLRGFSESHIDAIKEQSCIGDFNLLELVLEDLSYL